MNVLMQEPRFNCGPTVTVIDPDFSPEESQQGYIDLHRPSYSAVSTAPPSYASTVDDQTAEWWGVQAERILRGSNVQAIQFLCRFRPYADESLPRSILSKRWTPRLNTFLRHLGLEEGCQTVVDPDVNLKVEEILKRLAPSPSSDSRGHWTPQKAIHEPDASHVASELNEASFMEFKRISYPDLVTSIRCLLFYKLYENPVVLNPIGKTSSISSTPLETMRSIRERVIGDICVLGI